MATWYFRNVVWPRIIAAQRKQGKQRRSLVKRVAHINKVIRAIDFDKTKHIKPLMTTQEKARIMQKIEQNRVVIGILVPVVCGDLRGVFETESNMILVDGETITGAEFERRAGKASCKNFKSSCKVAEGKFEGKTLKFWMQQQQLIPLLTV